MQVILLSGGSGKRLWPLSNEARSKQFLRLLPAPSGGYESMVQRVVRQIREAGLEAPVTVATSASQREVIEAQLGEGVAVVTEPMRRDTFPAICLATAFLELAAHCDPDEVVVVMPCDPYTELDYFRTIERMVRVVEARAAELVLMGIRPTYPSAKYGYVVPGEALPMEGVCAVDRFTEKPEVAVAERLLEAGALWNGGVFAFRLGYMRAIAGRYVAADSFEGVRARYGEFPRISFDYEVVERARSVAVVPYGGEWKDLGTWNTLTDELPDRCVGNVVMDENSVDTHVVNELGIPVVCMGAKHLVVAASPDGILVSDKGQSEFIKRYADRLANRPMFEERAWGDYRVLDLSTLPDGRQSLTRQLRVKAGGCLPMERHEEREELITCLDGEGICRLEGALVPLRRGATCSIARGVAHTIEAYSDLMLMEVQWGESSAND